MTPADVGELEDTLRGLRDGGVLPRSVLLFSPAWDAEGLGLTERVAIERVWPGIPVIEVDRGRWDLDADRPADVPDADLGVICNTFMCSRDPAAWLDRIMGAVPLLVLQDLAVCRRGRAGLHTDPPTGDVMRYSVSSHDIIGESDPGHGPYDLSGGPGRVLMAGAYGTGCVKFVALIGRYDVRPGWFD